jgi:hypothetical protein
VIHEIADVIGLVAEAEGADQLQLTEAIAVEHLELDAGPCAGQLLRAARAEPSQTA